MNEMMRYKRSQDFSNPTLPINQSAGKLSTSIVIKIE